MGAVAAVALTGCADAHHRDSAEAAPAPANHGERIALEASTCAAGWSAPNPGSYAFSIANRSGHAADVALVQFGSGVTVGRASSLAPGAVSLLRAQLHAGGAYQWLCTTPGHTPLQSAVAQLSTPTAPTGAAVRTPASVATVQLIAPLSYYRQHDNALLVNVKRQLRVLRRRIAARNLAEARSAWLAAHLTWLEIGQDDGAYGAFGQLGGRIDGTASGIVGGASSVKFTGFHKVEFDLFRRHDLSTADRDARMLARLVGSITQRTLASTYLPANATTIGAWTLRCHEILEDALRDSLSADDDYGSHTDLESITADVAATREMLSVLGPLLNSRVPDLVSRGQRQLATLDAAVGGALAEARRGSGGAQAAALTARPIASLSRRRRARIEAAAGAALETLAPVSELMQVDGA